LEAGRSEPVIRESCDELYDFWLKLFAQFPYLTCQASTLDLTLGQLLKLLSNFNALRTDGGDGIPALAAWTLKEVFFSAILQLRDFWLDLELPAAVIAG
jgi:hypothetical protein